MTFAQIFEEMMRNIKLGHLPKTSRQYQDMRRCFYAGAYELIINPNLVSEVAHQVDEFADPGSYKRDTTPPPEVMN